MAEEEPKQVVVEREPEARSPVGTIVAIVVGVILVILLLIYGLPYLTGGGATNTDVNVETGTPTPSTTGT